MVLGHLEQQYDFLWSFVFRLYLKNFWFKFVLKPFLKLGISPLFAESSGKRGLNSSGVCFQGLTNFIMGNFHLLI